VDKAGDKAGAKLWTQNICASVAYQCLGRVDIAHQLEGESHRVGCQCEGEFYGYTEVHASTGNCGAPEAHTSGGPTTFSGQVNRSATDRLVE